VIIGIIGIIGHMTIAQAKLPIRELERLRQETIIARAVLDHPGGDLAKKCKFKIEKIGAVGSALELRYDEVFLNSAKWKLSAVEQNHLIKSASGCTKTASCAMYAKGVEMGLGTKLSGEDLTALRRASSLAKTEKPEDYTTAIKFIDEPCRVLSDLIK
jgi:hypothetical protein